MLRRFELLNVANIRMCRFTTDRFDAATTINTLKNQTLRVFLDKNVFHILPIQKLSNFFSFTLEKWW